MRALIVDDEFTAARYLEDLLLRHCPQITSITVETEPENAMRHLLERSADLMFLDIEMPGLGGFDLIERVGYKYIPPLIFTTAYHQYATKAFEVNAIHYLLKPIDPALLTQAVDRVKPLNSKGPQPGLLEALQQLSQPKERISLPQGQDYHLVEIDDIVRVEGDGSYCTFYLTGERKITVSKRLKVYLDKLQPHGFVRPHQSHLVNPSHIDRVSRADGGYLVMNTGHTVPFSKKNRNGLLNRLANLE